MDELLDNLREVVVAHVPDATAVSDFRRLSGGASQETWSFDATTPDGTLPMILRRPPHGIAKDASGPTMITPETEALLLELAGRAQVPVPKVYHVLGPQDGMGSGYIMERIEGETIARKILRDDAYAEARPKMARQCGEILARLHTIPMSEVPSLHPLAGAAQLEHYAQTYEAYDYPHPVFELAIRLLREQMTDVAELCTVHGDFRNGNLIVDRGGVASVIDWELAHAGDPMEDLGWLSVNSWRFGEIENPVGGFGTREDLFAGYEDAGGKVDAERVRLWEIFGSLKWGIMCMSMYAAFKVGNDRTIERAAIGRRSSEAEIDLMRLLAGDAPS